MTFLLSLDRLIKSELFLLLKSVFLLLKMIILQEEVSETLNMSAVWMDVLPAHFLMESLTAVFTPDCDWYIQITCSELGELRLWCVFLPEFVWF